MSAGKSDARGVAILFNNNFEFKVTGETKDCLGNLIVLDILIENRFTLKLINMYGPYKDNPH